MKRLALRGVTNITARLHDKNVIFIPWSDAPHKSSFRKNVILETSCRAGAPQEGTAECDNRNAGTIVPGDAMRTTKAVFFMQKDRPVAQLSIGAAPGKSLGLRACLMFMLGASLLCATAIGAPAPKAKTADTQSKATVSSDFVGSATCATCHEEVSKGFANNPHTKMALMHGDKGITCENCHGAGKAHVEGGGDPTKIFNPSKASAKDVDAKCMSCHGGAHPNFLRSPHAKSGLSCISCHSVHAAQDKENLLKASQPTLCFQCHSDVAPQFSMPFHHRVNEGLVKCTDCHDPHGTFNGKQLQTTAEQNMICTKCHMEKAGPFVYEHPVVKAEGCLACHSPHGSPNPRLLNVSNLNTLCLQCHSTTNTSAFPNALAPTGPVHSQATQYVACTNCHTQIHGSNASSVFFK